MLAQILTSATVIIMQITDLKPFRPCQKSSKRVDISSAFNSNPSDSYWPTTNPSFQCVWIFSERFLKSEIELILQTWARSQDFYESRATLSRWKPTHVFGMIKIYCVQQKNRSSWAVRTADKSRTSWYLPKKTCSFSYAFFTQSLWSQNSGNDFPWTDLTSDVWDIDGETSDVLRKSHRLNES